MLQPSLKITVALLVCAAPLLGLGAESTFVQEVAANIPKLQVAVVSVRVGISRDVTGGTESEVIDQSIDQLKTVDRESLTVTTERAKIRKVTASAQAGMGSGGLSLSANADASMETTDSEKKNKVRFTEKSADDERKRTETASITKSNKFTKDSGYVEVGLEINNPGETLDASIRIGVVARDPSGGAIAVGSVYVTERDDGAFPDESVTWLQVAPTSPDAPLLKSVRKQISTDQALEWLQQRLEFSADITNIVLKPVGKTTEFRPMDLRRRYELEGKAFVEVHRPGAASKSFLVDTRSGSASLEDVLRLSQNYEAGVTPGGETYIKSYGGIATTILPGATLAEVLGKAPGEGAWFVLYGRAAKLGDPLQSGDAISIMYLRRRDLLNDQSEVKEFSSQLTLPCRSTRSAYVLLSAVVTKDSLLELRIKGKRKLLESDNVKATKRVTDSGTLAFLTDQEVTRMASQTMVDIDREAWKKASFLFQVDEEDARTLDELEQLRSVRARYTTDAREHVIVVKLPEDYFTQMQSRRVQIFFAPEAGAIDVGRYQGFRDPGSSKFLGYSENKARIVKIALWRSEMPGTTVNLAREHRLTIIVATSNPGANLTPSTLKNIGFSQDPLLAPDACPKGLFNKAYPGGCDSPDRSAVSVNTTAQLALQVQEREARPRIRDKVAEGYCAYDGH